jgi:hypothetical protein
MSGANCRVRAVFRSFADRILLVGHKLHLTYPTLGRRRGIGRAREQKDFQVESSI